VAAVILESPFADYSDAVRSHADLVGSPGGWIQRLGIWMAQRISGADFSAVRPEDLIPTIRAPLLLIQSGDDQIVGSQTARLDAAMEKRPKNCLSATWRIEGVYHVTGYNTVPAEYAERVAGFLAAAGV